MFRACKGSLHSFRFKDPDDFKASTASGILDLGLGSGKPVYQLTKKYAVGQLVDYREIKKPVSNTLAVFKNSILQTQGTAPGNYSIDYTTGLVTFVASSQFSIISITVSPTNPIVTTSVAHNFTVGQKIYLSNLNPSTSLNLNAFTVTAVTSNTFTISVNNTVNVTAGTASLFPQPTDFLTASFEFDVPVRFDTDDMDTGIGDGGFIEWDSISLVEVRI